MAIWSPFGAQLREEFGGRIALKRGIRQISDGAIDPTVSGSLVLERADGRLHLWDSIGP
jgi:hypothetical protein